MTTEFVVGWKLNYADRAKLLDRFRPLFADVVADHVTLRSGADMNDPLPPERSGVVIGKVDDGAGVEALIVEIGGTIHRPDGGTWHMTWSLEKAAGRQAKESNDVIAQLGWKPLERAIPVALIPAHF